jgi:Na+/H+ antiporter
MQHIFIEYVYMIIMILALVMIANKMRLAYPIVLVVGGLLLSFLSVFPNITIDPEMVFFIFLPPLLYEAAWQVSWKEFKKFRRVIMSFAFPIVILTASVVAFVSQALIPGFTLALGFLLGGIVSPPDAISASTIMRQVKAPKAMVSIAEGESLLNDASSLIVFRFALGAVLTGQFFVQEAMGSFVLVVVVGTLIGLLVAAGFYAIHRWLPVTPPIEIVLTFVTPYCMYYAAEHFHFSGVLAVVSGGLFLSYKRQRMLSYISRIQSGNVWSSIVFILNGVVFLLIGLQLRSITDQLGNISITTATWYGIVISVTLILTRLICTIGASYFTQFMSRFIAVADARPGLKGPLILGWAGMRGVVSLAAALSIPLLVANDQAFPFRSLILYITFIVILITLVFQGLTLPWLIRKLNIAERENAISEHDQEMIIQKKLAYSTLVYLEQKYGTTGVENEHIQQLQSRFRLEFKVFGQELQETHSTENVLLEYQSIHLELLEQQRNMLHKINQHAEFDEDLIRKHLTLIDFEELKIRQKAI